jgi:hypothetical protein
MLEDVELITEQTKVAYRARVRPGTPADRVTLMSSWLPVLEDGPDHWDDREWSWATFGEADRHLDANPQWLVLADEVEQGASGELLGVLVTTGPATAEEAGINRLLEMDGALLWVEYIAVAPSIRSDCPPRLRRNPRLLVAGQQLMRAAIERSEELGLGGRIGLHAEGARALATYTGKRWNMICIGEAAHRAGGDYPVCFGDAAWAAGFCSGLRAEGRR